jgi:argininosuccinate lyase
MKLWQKDTYSVSSQIEAFTVGNDRTLDLQLARFDILGSLAHTRMLESIALLPPHDLEAIQKELKALYQVAAEGKFEIEEGVEDVHSQVELHLTRTLGDAGKKIHSGRSRNDQVLVDIKLYGRDRIQAIAEATSAFVSLLLNQGDRFKDVLLPGYTHLQVAMPSSFGLWFGAYAESLVDDLLPLQAAYRFSNKNPLGSGAGYGSSFPLNRSMTTALLGFESMHYNVVCAQMSRGKTEQMICTAIAGIAQTLSRFAMDVCLYNSQNFGFITLPAELTTGSSIMPHKKNPDVAELLRARCNRLKSLPNELALLITNLPSGYHRDMQLTKEILFPAFEEILTCIGIAHYMVERMEVNGDILKDPRYMDMFSVEKVNALVLSGVPFREAYKTVGNATEGAGNEIPTLNHTHEGSLGNLCSAEIRSTLQMYMAEFKFNKANDALQALVAT